MGDTDDDDGWYDRMLHKLQDMHETADRLLASRGLPRNMDDRLLASRGLSKNIDDAGDAFETKAGLWLVHVLDKIKADSPGRNEWLSETAEWALCWLIWMVTPVWLYLYGHYCPDEDQKNLKCKGDDCCEVNHFAYYAVSWLPISLIVPGFVMFLGFVSYSPSAYDWIQYAMNFGCLLLFKYAGGLVAFLLAYFASCIFLLPVIVAGNSKLAKYNYKSYTLGVGWTTGISNGICYILMDNGWMSDTMRWKVQVVGWTAVMSGSVILTACIGESESYKLTLGETLRYSAFQLAIYTFIYFGVCRVCERAFNDYGSWF